ncbi:MAG: hypothetical protein KDC03_21085 [Flavobacteriales bacterium]|nr:hypothetical protein [Flavobacteriales bacterium]
MNMIVWLKRLAQVPAPEDEQRSPCDRGLVMGRGGLLPVQGVRTCCPWVKLGLVGALMFSTFASQAQVAVYWDCDGDLSPTIVNGGIGGAWDITPVGATSDTYWSGCDPSGSPAPGDMSARFVNWPLQPVLFDPNYYLQVQVILAMDMTFNSLKLTTYRAGGGPTDFQVRWSVNGFSAPALYANYTEAVATCATHVVGLGATLVPAGTTVSFRFYAGHSNGISGQWVVDDLQIEADLATTLPVELVSFDAERGATSMVDLSWITASEDNCSHFTMERSLDKLEWSVAGTVIGAGNSQEEVEYKLVDFQAPQELVYYRLTQYDLDGHYRVYDDKLVAVNPARSALIFPNPAMVGQRVNVPSGALIIDPLGRQVQTGHDAFVPRHRGIYRVGDESLLVQ